MLTAARPIELLTLLFTVFLAAVTLLFYRPLTSSGLLLFRYGLIVLAVLSAILAEGRWRNSRTVSHFRDFLPLPVVLALFDSLGGLIAGVRNDNFDDLLIRLDLLLFGTHPTVWLEQFIHPWLTTLLQFAYVSYYPLPIFLVVRLAIRKDRLAFDESAFGIVLCFYLSYLGYLAVPAVGPRFALAALQTRGLEAGPLVIAIQNILNILENTKMDAFPSGHTAVALMTVYYSWRSGEKVLGMILLPVVTALIISTVYLRYHYVIDVVAGFGLAFLTAWIAPHLRRLLSHTTGQTRDQLHDSP